jgi:hypothetical protein
MAARKRVGAVAEKLLKHRVAEPFQNGQDPALPSVFHPSPSVAKN